MFEKKSLWKYFPKNVAIFLKVNFFFMEDVNYFTLNQISKNINNIILLFEIVGLKLPLNLCKFE